MLEDPCDKVIRIIKEKQQRRDYLFEEKVAIIDFLVKSQFGKNYLGKVSALHRLAYHVQYETYEKGKTVYTNMDNIDKHYIILNGRIAILESRNIEDMDYNRQRDQQFNYERTLSQHQANQQAKQLKKRCELSSYDSFGFNVEQLKHNPQSVSQVSDHIALVMENTHVLILKAKIIQENYIENQQLNCKFLGQKLQVEYTLLNDIICEQCFKKKGMFICQETQDPRFIYCVLYGSVLYQDQSIAGIIKNRVVLGEGAIIGQSLKGEKQNNQQISQNQQSIQRVMQRQNSSYNGIQLASMEVDIGEKKIEQMQSSVHSSSEFTVVLMIDKEKLHQKLIEYKRMQDHTINHHSSQMSYGNLNNTQKNKMNNQNYDISLANQIQQSKNQKYPPSQVNSPPKSRLVLQKKTRSQSYSIVCKLIQKEERSNSYSRIKTQFVELNPNFKKEFLNIEQPNSFQKKYSISQSFTSNQQNEKNNNQNGSSNNNDNNNNQNGSNNNKSNNNITKNDFEDIVKRLAEKSVFPLTYQKEKKYNKILMRNLRDREQITRLIFESKKPSSLPNYYSNPENYIQKDTLLHQFNTKYLQHNIREAKNHRQKRSQTHQSNFEYTNEDLDTLDANNLQTESDIDKFIQKINSQLINSQSQQNNLNYQNFAYSNANNQANRKILDQNVNSIKNNENLVDLNQEQDKLSHLTENNQQLFYPYRVQEMLDQFISLKKQESGQKNTESIQIRKSSIPQINQMDLQFQQQNQAYISENNQYVLPSCQQIDEIKELNSNLPSNTESVVTLDQNVHNLNDLDSHNYDSQVEIYSLDKSGDLGSHQASNNALHRNQVIQYYTQSQLSRLGSQGSIAVIPQSELNTANNIPISNGVLRSQSVHNIIRKQTEIDHQKIFAANQMYPNFPQKTFSKNINESKIKKFSKIQNEIIHKVLQTTELRLKKKQESQLNQVLSAECRNNNIFQPDKNISSLLSTHFQSRTLQNSQKSSRRQSSFKARPPTTDSSSSHINLTSRQIMLSQFNNGVNNTNQNSDKKRSQQQKNQEVDLSKPPTRTIVFSSGDRRFSRINQPQQKIDSQQSQKDEQKENY